MKKTIIFILATLFYSLTFGQDSLFIRNWAKPTKMKLYKKNIFFTLRYDELYNDTSNIMQKVSLSGKLKYVTDTSLTIAVTHEEINIDFKNGKSTRIESSYFQDPCDIMDGIHYGNELRTINFKKINLVYSSEEKKGYGFGSSLTGISVFSALIVAPLASINFRTGSFNKNRYYTIAGICLAGVTIGIPIILLTRNDKSYIISGKKPNNTEAYYLDRH